MTPPLFQIMKGAARKSKQVQVEVGASSSLQEPLSKGIQVMFVVMFCFVNFCFEFL